MKYVHCRFFPELNLLFAYNLMYFTLGMNALTKSESILKVHILLRLVK